MADQLPIIPKCGSILFHTGNIVNWNRLKKRMRQTSTEELEDCMRDTLSGWLATQDKTDLQYVTDIECINEKFIEKVADFPEERSALKVSVKLFLNSLDEESVRDALQKATEDLGTDYIETVILSVPEWRRRDPRDLERVYGILEAYVAREQVFSLGLADLDRDALQQLYSWAKTKPMVNQVNLAHCCVIPPELSDFAKEHNIQLLTHNDAKELLPEESLTDLLQSCLTPRDAATWQPAWVLRYSVIAKQRGVIKTKGYIAKATRNVKRK